MKFDFKNVFGKSSVKYGSYTAIMTAIVLAVLIVINLVASSFNLRFDLTDDKMYTISDTSKEIVSSLEQDVTIYTLYRTGNENITFNEILLQYAANSKRITLENRDPYLYPQFVTKYTAADDTVPEGSIIVESGDRFKVIKVSELTSSEFDYNTFQSYTTSIDVEPRVTGAINYLISGDRPKAYVMTGHGEKALSETYTKALTDENYEIAELNLIPLEAVPEDCDLLLILAPTKDYSPDEIERIKKYLDNNGRGLFVTAFARDEQPNLRSLYNYYGMDLQRVIVVEGSSANALQGNPLYLLPNISTHEITEPIIAKKYPILLPSSQGIEIAEVRKKSLTFDPLLATSNSAYGKTNLEAQTAERETGDMDGPFTLAIAATDTYYENETTYIGKVVLISSMAVIDDSANEAVIGTNANFFVNCANWLVGSENSTYIAPKSLTGSYLTMNGSQQLTLMIFSVIVVPVVSFAAGIVVWLRRKNK